MDEHHPHPGETVPSVALALVEHRRRTAALLERLDGLAAAAPAVVGLTEQLRASDSRLESLIFRMGGS
jgi:hypothetical protein